MAIVIAYVFGFVLSGITGLHIMGNLFDTDPFAGRQLHLRNLVLPALTLGIRPMAIIAQLTRGSLLDTLNQDYIRTARAKGLPEHVVIYRHALRNAIIPVMTLVGLQFGALLAGAIVTETIFSWPGIGRLTVSAISNRDYALVQGCILAVGLTYVLVNLLTDLLYTVANPRIRS